MSSIQTQFNDGMKKAQVLIDKQLHKFAYDCAFSLLVDAVNTWQGYDMTGNTINSYAAAVYHKGKQTDFIPAWEAGVDDRATSDYAKPGDVIFFYHSSNVHSEDGSDMGRVNEYAPDSGFKFQEVGRGYGEQDAKNICKNYKATAEWEILVVVGVPYASYLENVRKLDVLSASFAYAPAMCDQEVLKTKPL